MFVAPQMGAPFVTQSPDIEALGLPSPKQSHCQKNANIAIQAMLEMLRSRVQNGVVSIASIERVASVIMDANGPLSPFFAQSQDACHAGWKLAEIERQRTNLFGRLLAEPIEELLDRPAGIERNRLCQLFEAVRMMLGEEVYESLTARTTLLAQDFRGEDGMVDWHGFHSAPENHAIIEQVLVAIARSFRRFEPRKDWLLVVLNSTPNSVSVGPNAFAQKSADEKVQFAFSEVHLCNVLTALFHSVQLDSFDKERSAAFTAKWGVEPEKVFGPFFIELLSLSQRAKPS